jgi:N-acetylglutamate synthase-like GNAT family acetyltransferase
MASWYRDEYCVSTDTERLDLTVIHEFLSQESYWAQGISRALVERSVANSVCFGLYHQTDDDATQARQIGFARLITDKTTFAYLADVFVLPAYRGRGLSKWLMQCVTSHKDVQGLRRWMLATRDAHSLYAQVGFVPLDKPEIFMQRHEPRVYQA